MTNLKFNLATTVRKDLINLHELIHRAGDHLEDDHYQQAADVLQDAIKPLIFLIGKLRQENITRERLVGNMPGRDLTIMKCISDKLCV